MSLVGFEEFPDLFRKIVPNDHSHQVVSEYYVDYLFARYNNIQRVMDLGCGAGNSIDIFRKKNPHIRWIGVDIESSPDVDSRTRTDGEFCTYDGIHMPFGDNCVDLIYSNQVFEHVRYPRELLKEVSRVLRAGGYFTGSTSQFEPHHADSLWNYTPYGFFLLMQEAGLELIELRPSIDALTIIIRRGLGRPKFFKTFWTRESPLNIIINIYGKIKRRKHAEINLMKLLFCGQFCFLARKPEVTYSKEDS